MTWLDRAARQPFAWGQSDCVLEVADWLDFACGTDIAGAWRGQYATEAEADALVAPLGGLLAAMQAEAAARGIAEAAEPQFGDVALVTLPGQEKPLAAILMPSGRWRMKTATGIVLASAVTVLAAWTLPCRPVPAEHEVAA